MVMMRAGLLLAGALVAMPALAAPAPDPAGQGRDLLLEAQIEPASVSVQSQAVYRLRFYHAIDVRDLKITAPSAHLADLRPIGEARIYESRRDGLHYRVHERSYAVFPFASGTLELAGAHASGRVAAPAEKLGDGRRSIKLDAPSRTLTVLPASDGAEPWLPARTLTLSENWSPPSGEARLGSALRRTIRIEAGGVDASQLPELNISAAGMTVYAEPPRLENSFEDELNIATREQTFLMIPQRAGDIDVPQLRLRWWNTAAGAFANASLPARTVHVVAGDMATTSIIPVPPAASANPPAIVGTIPPTRVPTRSSALLWVAIGMFFIVAALVYFGRARARASWRLFRACRSGKADAVRDGLLAWAATIWTGTPPATLATLAEHLEDPAARAAVTELERQIYGPEARDEAVELHATARRAKRAMRLSLRRRHCKYVFEFARKISRLSI